MPFSATHRNINGIASLLAIAILLGVLASSFIGGAAAQPLVISGSLTLFRTGSGNEGIHVSAGPPGGSLIGLSSALQPATISVTYHGFSAEAQTAFAYAVDIWAQQISSPVPIQVDASWTPLGTDILGSAGPTYIMRDFAGAPQAGTWYHAALANKLRGSDLAPGSPDITANFSSAFSSWYFGTDGNTPPGQYDFVTVVLHELAHGIGVSGMANVDGAGNGSLGDSGFPSIYDRYTTDSAGTPLLSYASPAALGTALRASTVYFTGSNARAANGNANVRLYAPATWSLGSSYSHLDETFNGTSNALMTYSLSPGESIHDPGNVVRGILKDVGWTTAAPTPTSTPTATSTPTMTPVPTSTPGATIVHAVTAPADPSQPVTVPLESPAGTINVTLNDLRSSGVITTQISTSSPSQAQSSFTLVGVNYELTTSGISFGQATLQIPYRESDVAAAGVPEESLRLMHFDHGQWKDITTGLDTTANIITGVTESFSPFMLGVQKTQQCAISINTGAAYIGHLGVQIFSDTSGAAEMLVSNDAGFVGAQWQPYHTALPWTMTNPGNRVVTLLTYVRLRDANLQLLCSGLSLGDNVIYDPLAPSVTATIIQPLQQTPHNAQTGMTISVRLSALDQQGGSGVTDMQLSTDASFSGAAWQPFSTTAQIVCQPGDTVYVRVRDAVGNSSDIVHTTLAGQHVVDLPLIAR